MKTQTQPFSKEFLTTIEQLLNEAKERLETELASLTNKNTNGASLDDAFPIYGDGEDDNVHEIEEYTTNKPLEITLEKSLNDVNKALERLKLGMYGICKYCDQPIAEKRLLARPTSSACVSCKKTLTDEA